MNGATMLGPVVLLGVAFGCAEAAVDPVASNSTTPAMHVGAPAASCPLAPLPPSANVVLCFNATLDPGFWHGWILELNE